MKRRAIYRRVVLAEDSDAAIRDLGNRDLRKFIRHAVAKSQPASDEAEQFLAVALVEAATRFLKNKPRTKSI